MLALALPGCGGGTPTLDVPGGTVHGTAKVGGTPLPGGYGITFEATDGSYNAYGTTDETGAYKLANHFGGDQVPATEYKVYFAPPATATELSEEAMANIDGAAAETPAVESAVPEQYLAAATTDLKFTVSEGDNTIDIEIVGE